MNLAHSQNSHSNHYNEVSNKTHSKTLEFTFSLSLQLQTLFNKKNVSLTRKSAWKNVEKRKEKHEKTQNTDIHSYFVRFIHSNSFVLSVVFDLWEGSVRFDLRVRVVFFFFEIPILFCYFSEIFINLIQFLKNLTNLEKSWRN